MAIHFARKVEATSVRRMTIGIVLTLALTTALATTAHAAQQSRKLAAACSARGTSMSLEVRCPSATVADLLAALRQATGLRSECPGEIAGARVAINMSRVSLTEVFDRAFAAFNYAVWTDMDGGSAVTWLKIVDVRRAVEAAAQPAPPQDAAMLPADTSAPVRENSPAASTNSRAEAISPASDPISSAETPPMSVSIAALAHDLSSPASQANTKANMRTFAQAVTPGSALQPPPIDTASGAPPVNTLPVAMPRIELAH